MAVDDRLRHRSARLQLSSWQGDEHTVLVTPASDGDVPDCDEIATLLDRLGRRGVRRVLTSALHASDLAPFERNGFRVHEYLHLLRHDLIDLPDRGTVPIRRARRRDRAQVLDIDRRAFDDFWTLDRDGLDDALRATPVGRFRVSTDRTGTVTGYSVTGRAGDRGYLQRLGVDPDRHRAGAGRALVADALSWLARRGARQALVNTQLGNDAALALYRASGFVAEPAGLTVLVRDLAPA